ncbi:MAG: capsular biosynthesis protein [Oscillospiraceae bacterium]|nr:capsular biosynthesis protein [Oscillospiraceae bacterium]
MIDLHTHILPGIDDGAGTLNESIKLLQMEIDSGVKTVALTPHYRPSADTLKDFLRKRKDSYKRLSAEVERRGLRIKLILGAEVAYSPDLLEMDIDEICYEGTKTILIELPPSHYPTLVKNVFYELLLRGYTPLIAHCERYPYFSKNTELLEELVYMGAIVQINAGPFARKWQNKRRLFSMINEELVHTIATDTHSVDKRPPKLKTAMKVIEKKLGIEAVQRLVSFEL